MKKSHLVLSSIVLCLGLAACGKKEEAPVTPAPAPEQSAPAAEPAPAVEPAPAEAAPTEAAPTEAPAEGSAPAEAPAP
jgi:hypothetical protein